MRIILQSVLSLLLLTTSFGCAKKEEEKSSSTQVVPGTSSTKYLYFGSGQCNSGAGVTTFSSANSSRMISKVNLQSGSTSTVFDFAASYQGGFLAPETGAQSLVDTNSTLLLLTENAINMGERKIFSIPKSSPYNTTVYSNDVLALTQTAAHITRDMVKDTDGSLLFSKSVGIEKIGTNFLRIPMAANSWVNAPAGLCATSTTLISGVKVMPPYTGTTSGKIIFSHQGTTAAVNRLGIVSQDGYSVGANCLNGYQISSVTHTYAPNVTGPAIVFAATGVSPTAMVYIPTPTGPTAGKLIVAYSSTVATEVNNNTNLNFAIVMWNVNEPNANAASLSSPVVLYRDFSVIFGISAMAYDPDTSALYVATASQPGVANQTTSGYGYKIEKFNLDTTAPSLTLVRPNNLPFVDRSSATKCISTMVIGSQ